MQAVRSFPHRLNRRQIDGKPLCKSGASDYFVKHVDIAYELAGHTGCVNALDWSESSRYLASGSDDKRIIIWDSHSATFEKAKDIYTGHTRNIFSVRFMPGTDSRTLVTAAGDAQIRVHDVEYEHASVAAYTETATSSVFNTHRDRVKRIEVENDGHCFLSCSEDGDVHQFDLRVSAGRVHRAPLISYAQNQIDLTAMSLNRGRPYLLAVAGTHPCAFLHDRRMLGRNLARERGSIQTIDSPTHCVRQFRSGNRMKKAARNQQITALRFGSSDPKELICSWLNDDIFLFDIDADISKSSRLTTKSTTETSHILSETPKRKRTSSDLSARDQVLVFQDDDNSHQIVLRTRGYLLATNTQRLDYKTSYLNFLTATPDLPVTRTLAAGDRSIQDFEECKLVLGALADDPTSIVNSESVQFDNWHSTAIRHIAVACSSYCTSSILDEPLVDFEHENDGAVYEVSDAKRILFPSHSMLVQVFNTSISSDSGRMHLRSSAARKLWLEGVCRSLLRERISDSPEASSLSMMSQCPYDKSQTNAQEIDLESQWSDSSAYVAEYDSESDVEGQNHEPTENSYTSNLFDVHPGVAISTPIRSFSGHVNVETIKDVNFLGLEDEFVMSGSDDGILFIWKKSSGDIVAMLQGDSNVTNAMEANASCTSLAVSGIDDTVKIFQPHLAVNKTSRRVQESEYEIRARNKMRMRQEYTGGHLAMSSGLMMQIAGQMHEHDQCRQQ